MEDITPSETTDTTEAAKPVVSPSHRLTTEEIKRINTIKFPGGNQNPRIPKIY